MWSKSQSIQEISGWERRLGHQVMGLEGSAQKHGFDTGQRLHNLSSLQHLNAWLGFLTLSQKNSEAASELIRRRL